jgi:hypothetical protein
LNKGSSALSPSQRFREKRSEKRVELVRRAVVGVEGDEDGRFAGYLTRDGGERSRPDLLVPDGGAREIRRAAG